MISVDIEQLVTFGTIIVAFSTIAWRISRLVTVFENGLNDLKRENDNLKDRLQDIQDSFNIHKQEFARLEGMHDSTLKALISTVRDLQTATGKVDAMWLTLQRLFPDKVPARLSDKASSG